ncbi:MAG: hypothetical protein M0P73_07555 [Syntrophobacterales bacterium]|jgi:hypothetical protein|nr:hypothetical protein [Syntrophobacterales bacterium]
MVPSVLIYALTGVLLSACVAMAVKPDRRRRALRAARIIFLLGLLFAAYEFLVPQIPERVMRPLVFCLFLIAGPAFLGCDLAAGLPWRQALAKNRGGLVFSAGWGIIGLLAMVMGV